MMGYFRLGWEKVNECPAGFENWPRRGYKKEISYCENTKKPATSFPSYDPTGPFKCKINSPTLFILSDKQNDH